MKQGEWFPEMDSMPGEDAGKIVKVTTKDAKYYINFIDKAAAGSEKTDSNFKVLLWVKCYRTA